MYIWRAYAGHADKRLYRYTLMIDPLYSKRQEENNKKQGVCGACPGYQRRLDTISRPQNTVIVAR